MKIVDQAAGLRFRVVGLVCDRCGDSVRDGDKGQKTFHALSVDTGKEGRLIRSDLCGACGALLFELLHEMPKPSLRTVGSFDRKRQFRTYRYEVIEDGTGSRIGIDTLMPEIDLM
ncbi:MAG: hypothetical protein OJJ21_19240 [Ferrovibrio sp.]|jgi:hypothetical protein|uniref:hypothetical protein n=1 Tax=Ferrovibrio sp. TaxID=1917215 RepID=UPI00261E140F|nr:hypothetical protein [Ferrovibrio sp.]MCW0235744.1 hypothetical protein [Ferrovibrio sp.]